MVLPSGKDSFLHVQTSVVWLLFCFLFGLGFFGLVWFGFWFFYQILNLKKFKFSDE